MRRDALPQAWSREEVEATVADYLDMLYLELRGQSYSKTEHRRRLLPLLNERSEGAIERKHGNISAVLIALGYPYIEGYKPFVNYQQLLFNVVEQRVAASPELEALIAADVSAPAPVPSVENILSVLVGRPRPTTPVDLVREPSPGSYQTARRRPPVDYLKRESENRSLGAAGEQFVLSYERARLVAAGQERLAARIEHVSEVRGDGDGFDILSYEASGEERLIEVKTTKYGAQTPFFVSRNEVQVSEQEAHQYHLYRLFGFRKAPKLFAVPGSLRAGFSLTATEYVARIA